MALIDYRVEDGLGIIEINNPPANVYTLESLKLLDQAIIQARFDSSVYVLVLMGAGRQVFQRRRRHSDAGGRSRRVQKQLRAVRT